MYQATREKILKQPHGVWVQHDGFRAIHMIEYDGHKNLVVQQHNGFRSYSASARDDLPMQIFLDDLPKDEEKK